MRTGRHALGLAPLLALLLVACAGNATPPPTPTLPAATPELPADPDTLVVQLRSAGGLMAPDYVFRDLPRISVYADGRMIVEDASREVHPGSLLPALVVGQLELGQVEELLAAAAGAGLASGSDVAYPARGAADVPATTFITWDPRGVTQTSFGALGIGTQPDDPAEIAARAGALAFAGQLAELAQSIEPGAYRPAAVRLAVRPYAVTDPAYVRDPVEWPLAWSLATAGTPVVPGSPEAGRCVVVSGADLDRLWPVAAAADGTTPFVSEGGRYALVARPLLPDEAAVCP